MLGVQHCLSPAPNAFARFLSEQTILSFYQGGVIVRIA